MFHKTQNILNNITRALPEHTTPRHVLVCADLLFKWQQLRQQYTTYTHDHWTALCPGLPGWGGTRRNNHPHTPILIIKHPLSTSSTMIHSIPLFNLRAWQSFSTTSLQVLLVWQQDTTKSTANSSAVSEYSMVISLLTKQFTEHVARARAVPNIRLVFASAPNSGSNSGFTFGRTVCPDWIWIVGTHTLAVYCCTANTRDGV